MKHTSATTLTAIALSVFTSTLFSSAMAAESNAPATPPKATAVEAPERDRLEKAAHPIVIIDTSLGAITVELWEDKAPLTVANFLSYADKGFYNDLIFHRVIRGFMIQGGGFTKNMQKKKTDAPIKNEARADAPNSRGTLAMARTSDVNSATAQFFINLVNNASLDHKNNTPAGYGYAVFGKVTSGMDVVDKMAAVQTGRFGPFNDVPREAVVIKSIKKSE
ncbi:MAG: peptidylprolyl isomerase [Kiritimatiellae bacterium]|nr:peptidylprolyl isomerase [Kiritimatiellia bacterium]